LSGRIFLSPPRMTGHEFKYLYEAFHTNWIAPLGGNVDAFENELCALTCTKAAAALSSGTAAVFLGLKALDVGEGDSVLCSDLTFAGSCFPVTYLGARPVFIDSEPEVCNMSPDALRKALEEGERTGRTPKAVIIVDLYGNPADYEKLLPLCRDHGVPVLEDAAEALGSSYKGKSCGAFGELAAFSFNGNKIVTTSGGGAAISSDARLIEKIRFWAAQSREPAPYYEHKEIGYNYRLSNICAGIGRGQLIGLSEKMLARRRIRDFYRESLKDCPVRFIEDPADARSNCWLSVMLLDPGCRVSIPGLISALEKQNIESRHMWKPMHLQPVFNGCGYYTHFDGLSVSSDQFSRGICLPSGEELTEDQLELIAGTVKSCFL
jgi:pyridoxal phosphate-dependent aminotransferase EpsN